MLLIILDTLRRILGDAKPIDIWMLVIEILVLAIIGAEAGYAVVHGISRRHKLRTIYKLVADGRILQKDAPRGAANVEIIAAWEIAVNKWQTNTENQLKEYSAQAEVAFLQETPIPSVPYGRVSWQIDKLFDSLNMRLANLRSIMEKPEVYF